MNKSKMIHISSKVYKTINTRGDDFNYAFELSLT